jgi:hypothetical protein
MISMPVFGREGYGRVQPVGATAVGVEEPEAAVFGAAEAAVGIRGVMDRVIA